MNYSSAGFLALIVHLIVNHDVLLDGSAKGLLPSYRSYRSFLLAVTVYYAADTLWGVLYERKLTPLVFADTAIYFVAMAFSILLWTRFVIDYLRGQNRFGWFLTLCGELIFVFQIFFVVVNFQLPVLYSFDYAGVYHAGQARYVTLAVQIFMFLLTAAYAFFVTFRSSGTVRLRHRTIGLSSLAMAVSAIGQVYYPLLPLYAIGCLLSTCVLHSFVLENEKEEYREDLEQRLQDNILQGNYYDLLTGLPGMSHFFQLVQSKRDDSQPASGRAFLYLNLSGMKFYNQQRGFAAGDQLLRSFADLLISAFGSDNCSRLGHDHFGVFVPQDYQESVLRDLFNNWETLNDNDCPAILVGVYRDDVDGVDTSTACDLAKIACDAIRTTYASSLQYYGTTMFAHAEQERYITSHLDQALAEGWVQVYYQPIVRATNGRVCDEEALARWIDPTRGFMSPADFIPILEEAKLIYKLDLYVVDQVLAKMNLMQESGLFLVPQSINLSRSDFDSCDIVQEIVDRVDAAGLPHRLFTIEITESVIGDDFDYMKAQAERFQSLGFPVWMDDFGSGYSSLDVLESMQLDLIKFDMSFMQRFDEGEKSRIVLTELMKMAIGLGIDTVCEGVERKDQVEFLREIGCSKLQGFYYTKPLSLQQVLDRYKKGTQIGFENPRESSYYDALSRINLFDLAVVAQEDADDLQRYFHTVPMAVVEVAGSDLHLTRSNQAYRTFMQESMKLHFDGPNSILEDPQDNLGTAFIGLLRQHKSEGSRGVCDLTLADGSVAHFFMRHIAVNAVTGATAIAVAVLAVSEPSR